MPPTNELDNHDVVRRGYEWLGHKGQHTEISVLHPEFIPGDTQWNWSHNAWPRTHYINCYDQLSRLVRTCQGHRFLCYGLNPRPGFLRYPNGRVRSARNDDITVSQSLLLDIDLVGTVSPERSDRAETFLTKADGYFTSLGLRAPVRSSTGRGYHLLFAYPPIRVADVPDIAARLKQFKDQFVRTVSRDLLRLEAKVDTTQDLRRMVRVYGTSKPSVGKNSTFTAKYRFPDEALREYIVGMSLPPPASQHPLQPLVLEAPVMPEWFPPLLERDQYLRGLWHGTGKSMNTDQSNSGYDYTIAHYLAQQGHQQPVELACIIALRPAGQPERLRKGLAYLARTIDNALQHATTQQPADEVPR